jgi:hypothetical protein
MGQNQQEQLNEHLQFKEHLQKLQKYEAKQNPIF